MSMLLSAEIGKYVSAAQLLGKEATDNASRQAEAEKGAATLLKKTKGKRLDEGVQYVATPFGG